MGETAGCGSSGQREVAGMSLHEVSWERVTLSWGSHAKLDSRGHRDVGHPLEPMGAPNRKESLMNSQTEEKVGCQGWELGVSVGGRISVWEAAKALGGDGCLRM